MIDLSVYPNPNEVYPMAGAQRLVFLKNIVDHPQIEVGDYTYYDDPEDVYNFQKNILYLVDFIKDKLFIGKFCQIATGVRFMMGASNHSMKGVSTYPFRLFGKAWAKAPMEIDLKGDTVIGNDVWIGNSVTILPGIKIGHGAIIGAHSLVTKHVDPYTIVGGNPARIIRKRFNNETIEFLLRLSWWDWPVEKITEHIVAIANGDFETLKAIG